MIGDEFLDDVDNKILEDVFIEFGVKPGVWHSFSPNGTSIQFDGDLSLIEMKAFTEAMSRMEKRHKNLSLGLKQTKD